MAGDSPNLMFTPSRKGNNPYNPDPTSDTITVKVGMPDFNDGSDIFTVQKSVLYNDDQFRGGCWINGDRTVHLRAKPEDFKTYMTWLYTRRLPEHIADPKLDTESNLDWLPTSYGLARKVGDPRYQDVLISRMIECARRIESFPNISFVASLYDVTEGLAHTPDILGRDLMIDIWTWKCRPEWQDIDYFAEADYMEFSEHLISALIAHRNASPEELVEPWASSQADRYLVGATQDE
ncbi:uncharacterized protein J4E84_000992 [Alternaria hordeiaustralica]|uniref:uncharacterized protein n=1 Tax=Alternaria hordeiaustralica TaxID=1187925 RepID=UPI0020C3B54C|nr:uncharacterized protein J4E84_000992 [Alternaria hordeiaustralica]KAI4697859.1 hypothetical protein J4E84_000992 [Alternaria hordeiaustralica]